MEIISYSQTMRCNRVTLTPDELKSLKDKDISLTDIHNLICDEFEKLSVVVNVDSFSLHNEFIDIDVITELPEEDVLEIVDSVMSKLLK